MSKTPSPQTAHLGTTVRSTPDHSSRRALLPFFFQPGHARLKLLSEVYRVCPALILSVMGFLSVSWGEEAEGYGGGAHQLKNKRGEMCQLKPTGGRVYQRANSSQRAGVCVPTCQLKPAGGAVPTQANTPLRYELPFYSYGNPKASPFSGHHPFF